MGGPNRCMFCGCISLWKLLSWLKEIADRSRSVHPGRNIGPGSGDVTSGKDVRYRQHNYGVIKVILYLIC
jgi:hypothetical protein